MIRMTCDGCNKDLHDDELAYADTIQEIKKQTTTVVMHFCATCQDHVITAFENAVKELISNGKA